jgi:hypothetical protein
MATCTTWFPGQSHTEFANTYSRRVGDRSRTPQRALADLEARLHKARAPVTSGLRPGLSPSEANDLFRSVSLSVDPALLALYIWRDGTSGSGSEAELLPGARFPALEESIKSREFELRLAAENEALPEHPAAFFFDPGWFPILEEAGGILYVVENFGAGRVLVVDRQSPGNPEELAGALVPFIDGVARDGLRFRPAPLSDDAAALVSRLASKEPGVRMKASRELVRKRPASAFEPLVALLESNDDEVRREAALVLGELRDRRAIPILIRCIARWRGNDVASAWGGLAAIGKEGAFGHLEKALAEGDSELRMDAIKGLAVSRDARAVPALQAAASGDPDTPVREAAGQALRVLGKPR